MSISWSVFFFILTCLMKRNKALIDRLFIHILASFTSLTFADYFIPKHCLLKILLAKFSLKRPSIAIKEPGYSKFC